MVCIKRWHRKRWFTVSINRKFCIRYCSTDSFVPSFFHLSNMQTTLHRNWIARTNIKFRWQKLFSDLSFFDVKVADSGVTHKKQKKYKPKNNNLKTVCWKLLFNVLSCRFNSIARTAVSLFKQFYYLFNWSFIITEYGTKFTLNIN